MPSQIVVRIPTESIKPDPRNLRTVFDEDEIAALGRNMQELGQLEPIKVFLTGDSTYDLYDGERRWRAAVATGIGSLDAIVEERPDQETLVFKKLSRHLQTKGLTKQEEVRAVEESLSGLGILDNPSEWAQYGNKLGGELSKIKELMRVAGLSRKLREKFDSGELPYTVAQSIGRVEDTNRQEALSDFVLDNSLSGRFVTTQLVPQVLENPGLPLTAVYDLARHKERWRYAKPQTKLRVEQSVADLTDDLVDALIKAEQALEEAAAGGQIAKLASDQFYRDRLLQSIDRLIDVLTGFSRSFTEHFEGESYEEQKKLTSG